MHWPTLSEYQISFCRIEFRSQVLVSLIASRFSATVLRSNTVINQSDFLPTTRCKQSTLYAFHIPNDRDETRWRIGIETVLRINHLIRCAMLDRDRCTAQQSSQDAVSPDHVGIIGPSTDKSEHRKARLEDLRGFINDNPRHLVALLWQAPAIRDQVRHDDQRTEKQVRCTSRAALRLRAMPVTRHRWVLPSISCFIHLSLSYLLYMCLLFMSFEAIRALGFY